MGKTYKDKPDKWRQPHRQSNTGPRHGTLNHANKPSKPYTLPEDRQDEWHNQRYREDGSRI